MPIDSFPSGVAAKLGWYVYRLIDPEDGETFYVGKGTGDRIFHHVRGDWSKIDDEDTLSLKAQRIQEIRAAEREVRHVVHRHGIPDQKVAYEVEAALIDTYPGLTNIAGGHGSGDRGPRSVEEIIAQYAAEPFDARHRLLLVSVGLRLSDDVMDIYEAARYAWKVARSSVESCEFVLAHNDGIVIGAFRWDEWIEATSENFPGRDPVPGRLGFRGGPAAPEAWDYYVGTHVPDRYRSRGAANPIRYCEPD